MPSAKSYSPCHSNRPAGDFASSKLQFCMVAPPDSMLGTEKMAIFGGTLRVKSPSGSQELGHDPERAY